jgi:protein-L-isoaspartate(D-aspartate) O-methyltransferase
MGKKIFILVITSSILFFASACGNEDNSLWATIPSNNSNAYQTLGAESTQATSAIVADREQEFSLLRKALVENSIKARGIDNPEIIRAMETVPRHKFVLEQFIDYAYEDHPLPIGYGQTISQPYIVALMTELLDLNEGEKVLEIGTGSGYQAAVLGELGFVDVYTVEIIPELAERAATTLEETGYTDVHVKQGDGYYGWEEFAPYDAIIVTAAPDHVPAPLVAQLKDGGVLVIPIGPPGGYQTLWCFYKNGDELKAYNYGGVSFVPLTGGEVETTP